ncbi:Sugar (and other) transporter [Rubrobacter radiotolerans]|uniref:Putative proline/betaine transporter n=1 Tax=Rubrobacter radiotolerans TaxID=42256 RepID=A0A023X0M8_RUBRA|nr:MFS transporter [Rubrobacter radiotolerans]AHY45903.1 Sugar (and other) transporter [Rubrobacter radiotolerans]MDX5893317.1 MFS transporter [Rubrobacter radiotolerans]SMC03491.1 metabolite-proton symporter [Rubrobacter radiotolerans DSM 5868]
MSSASADARVAPEREIRKVALTALAGTSIEWYDFFIYATAAALVFPTLFFPAEMPPLVATIASFSTFAVGFIARPVGGAIFGHFGDKVGRKKALVTALLMMGIATTLIGLLPTYALVGAAAPLMLVVLRFVQGLAIGGQWGGAVLLATESAPGNRRGFYGSFAQVGVPVGVILANLIFLLITAIVTPEFFAAWGWRIPFLLSIVLIGIGLYIQLRLEDTPAFRHLEELKAQRDEESVRRTAEERGVSVEEARREIASEREGSPVIEAFKNYPKQIALAAGAFVAVNGNFYIFISFIIAYATNPDILGLQQSTVLAAVLAASVFQIPALLFAAAISDRLGRRGIYMAGAALLGLWAFAFWPLVNTGSFALILVALLVGQVFLSMMYGPQAAFFAEIFSTKVRYSGASLGYQIGSIFGGAFAPIIATALLARFGGSFPISVYMALLCAVSLVSVLLLTETYQSDIDDAEKEKARVGSGREAVT